LLSGLAARASGDDFSAAYWLRIETGMEFMAALIDGAGNAPMIGDAADSCVVRLAPEQDFCPYKSLIPTGSVLFKRTDFAAKAGLLDAKTLWLLGDDAHAAFEADTQRTCAGASRPVSCMFPDSGYYLLGDQLETPEEVRLLVDAGPLGYLSLAAHGHA